MRSIARFIALRTWGEIPTVRTSIYRETKRIAGESHHPSSAGVGNPQLSQDTANSPCHTLEEVLERALGQHTVPADGVLTMSYKNPAEHDVRTALTFERPRRKESGTSLG